MAAIKPAPTLPGLASYLKYGDTIENTGTPYLFIHVLLSSNFPTFHCSVTALIKDDSSDSRKESGGGKKICLLPQSTLNFRNHSVIRAKYAL
jgi:hypothetical protein